MKKKIILTVEQVLFILDALSKAVLLPEARNADRLLSDILAKQIPKSEWP